MSPVARLLQDESGGCLRCDGPLRMLTEEETAVALREQDQRSEHKRDLGGS